MRKQMKIAAVVSAAALLALGASITSFAAQKGTWKYEDGEWYCYDKNGDVYTNTFCLSNGKEFYVGDNGELTTSSWVEYDGEYYFVNSAGQKIVNDWRLATPYDDDSADEEWFYFQSSGKMARTKKLAIKGKTYFFNGDGKMLTGWVTADGTNTVDEANSFDSDITYYCDETGARLEKAWVKSTEPGTDEDDTDADEYYYYLKSSGKAATGKQANIKSQTYFFDTEGRMLTGWVAKRTDSNTTVYKEIGYEDSSEAVSDYNDVYYCGDEDDGHMKKNKWVKLWNPSEYDEEDDDNDMYWYWLEKNGKIYIPSTANAYADKWKFEGETLIRKTGTNDVGIGVAEKKVNSKNYLFNMNGEMMTGFVMMDDGFGENQMFYYGGSDDGQMKTGSQSIKDDSDTSYKFYFGSKTTKAKDANGNVTTSDGYVKGAGVTGVQSGKLYELGKLVTLDDVRYKEVTVAGKDFIINKNGSVQTSQVDYKEDGDTLIEAKGYEFDKTGPAIYRGHITKRN